MLLDELLVGLGFEYDSEELENFKDDLESTVGIVKDLIATVAGAVVAVSALTIASTKASDEQGKFAKEIGDTVENVSALDFAIRRVGGSSEGLQSSLKTLSIRAAEAARGVGSGVEAFGLLGLSATDSNGRVKRSSDLILEVSSAIQGLDRTRQIELADKLGLSDSLRLIQAGPSAIRELTQEAIALGVTTEEDARISAELQDSLTDLWSIMRQLARIISREVAPILTNVINLFTDWWKVNRQLIEQNFGKWVDALTKAMKILLLITGLWIGLKLFNIVLALASAFRVTAVAALLLNGAIALLPLLIAGIVVGLALLIEDAAVFFEGGESFIGSMLEKYPKFRSELLEVAAVFATIADVTATIFEGWKGIIDAISNFSLENLKEVATNLPGFVGDVTGLQRTDGTGAIQTATDNIGNGATRFVEDFIRNPVLNVLGLEVPESKVRNRPEVGTNVENLNITVQGGNDDANTIANSVFNVFQQTSQDLNSAVDQ